MSNVHNQILDRRVVVSAVEDSFGVGDVYDAEVLRTDYSGRGMYGATCFALVGTTKEFMKFFVTLAFAANHRPWDENFSEGQIAELIDASRTDNMGLDTVMYFPGWSLSEEE